jgi:hypothetical protein
MTKEPSWLSDAARRAQFEPWTLGRLLSALCEQERTCDKDLTTELRCDASTLRWLYLCRAPTDSHFAQNIEQIARRFGVDASRLAALVRRADALEALAANTVNAEERKFLLAARDREDGEESR